jgi:hypothetical protein
MHPGPTRRTFAKGTARSAHDDLNPTAKATNLMLNGNEDADCSPNFTELPAGGGSIREGEMARHYPRHAQPHVQLLHNTQVTMRLRRDVVVATTDG